MAFVIRFRTSLGFVSFVWLFARTCWIPDCAGQHDALLVPSLCFQVFLGSATQGVVLPVCFWVPARCPLCSACCWSIVVSDEPEAFVIVVPPTHPHPVLANHRKRRGHLRRKCSASTPTVFGMSPKSSCRPRSVRAFLNLRPAGRSETTFVNPQVLFGIRFGFTT
jgi:hypothetical protein